MDIKAKHLSDWEKRNQYIRNGRMLDKRLNLPQVLYVLQLNSGATYFGHTMIPPHLLASNLVDIKNINKCHAALSLYMAKYNAQFLNPDKVTAENITNNPANYNITQQSDFVSMQNLLNDNNIQLKNLKLKPDLQLQSGYQSFKNKIMSIIKQNMSFLEPDKETEAYKAFEKVFLSKGETLGAEAKIYNQLSESTKKTCEKTFVKLLSIYCKTRDNEKYLLPLYEALCEACNIKEKSIMK